MTDADLTARKPMPAVVLGGSIDTRNVTKMQGTVIGAAE